MMGTQRVNIEITALFVEFALVSRLNASRIREATHKRHPPLEARLNTHPRSGSRHGSEASWSSHVSDAVEVSRLVRGPYLCELLNRGGPILKSIPILRLSAYGESMVGGLCLH